jgi:signal transduction histidine kinase
VGLHLKNQSLVLEIADAGIGVPDEDKQRVFEKFYRSVRQENQAAKGTGLGLFLVKKIIDKHQGRVWIKDNQPQGATFVIELKKEAQA